MSDIVNPVPPPPPPGSQPALLTKVDVVVSAALPVHLVDEEAGDRLQQQAEDGHAGTEAERVPVPVRQALSQLVVDPKVDDVRQQCCCHPDEELEDDRPRGG